MGMFNSQYLYLGGTFVLGVAVGVVSIKRVGDSPAVVQDSRHDASASSATHGVLGDSSGAGGRNGTLHLGLAQPAAEWERGMALDNIQEREKFMAALMEYWAAMDPLQALSKATELGSGRLRTACIAAACRGWATRDPLAASAWAVTHLSGPVQTQAVAGVADVWAQAEPLEAAAWAASLRSSTSGAVALAMTFKNWVGSDSEAAASWACALPEGDTRDIAMQQLAVEWSDQDPAAAAQWVAKQAQPRDDGDLVDVVLNRWSADDPVAAASWVQTLPAAQQEDAYAMVLAVWAATDPAAAAPWAAEFPSGEIRERAIPVLVQTWAAIDPQKAVTWTLGLPQDAPESRKALEQAVRIWALNERGTIAPWINSQPNGPDADYLRSIASRVIAQNHPADAVGMAAAISDPAARGNVMAAVIERWRESDERAANDWLKLNPQDEATLDRLDP